MLWVYSTCVDHGPWVLLNSNVAQHKVVNLLKTWDFCDSFFNHLSVLSLSMNFVDDRALLQFPKVSPACGRVL